VLLSHSPFCYAGTTKREALNLAGYEIEAGSISVAGQVSTVGEHQSQLLVLNRGRWKPERNVFLTCAGDLHCHPSAEADL